MASVLLTVFLMVTMAGYALGAMGNTSAISMTYITFGKYPSGAVQISAKGDELWLVDNMQSTFRWTGSQWEKIPGWICNIGASPDGWAWGVGRNFLIYRWNKDGKAWDLMPGSAFQINALSKDEAVAAGVDYLNYIFKNGAWVRIGWSGTYMSIGDTEEVWAVNHGDQNVYRWPKVFTGSDNGLPVWTKAINGPVLQVEVQSPTRIVYRNDAKQAFVMNNDNSWQMISANASSVTIGRSNIFLIETKVHVLN